jgi:rsbT co-antagonist protein RsbR
MDEGSIPEMLKELRFDEAELARRRSFFEITDEDLQRLAGLKAFAERHADRVIEGLYELILGHPESRAFFRDDSHVVRVKRLQREYFLGLFSGRCDMAYVKNRLLVGSAHERVGMEPKWYLGAYARYLRLLQRELLAELDPATAAQAFESLQKLVYFDVAIAIDTYIARNIATINRHQAAIRELSTPVIRVVDRLLLLPLVGSIDSDRAQQVMETLLLRVVAEKARVVILDIAGVPVVDTSVADHLLQTTAAVRLLGARTVLTGISAQVARTVVRLGVDISTMETRAELAEGLQVALEMLGQAIVPIPAAGERPSGAHGRDS